MSAKSNDSVNNSTMNLERKMSLYNYTITNFNDTQYSQQKNYSRQPLREHNSSSIDSRQYSNSKNIVAPIYA